ncbi:M48 family metallopeptidase [Albimonas sp. CAU 1670]|uniref:M48 family metallopeptidase n=1 Tax=Albimonas sp. CAU 1670 TaxID=3032599 RepID=UPI0023DB69DA|nr:M48 family metallopeptidase [Albimonas sp. CAU 1670]MDF2231855.1 M48 family metallopeptidase [Albimonas sp. CAU 1670]
MLKFLPFLLVIGYALIAWRWSAWRLKRELAERARPLDHPEIEAAVRRLGRALEIPHLQAHVYDVPVFNGLAAPDGRVFVTAGVLDQHRLGRVSTDEVASIVAHELGHVGLGHSRRRMIDWTGQNAIRWAAVAILGRFIPFIGPWIGAMLASLLAARLSRQDEYEADAFAAALMRKAGLSRDAQASLLRKLERMNPGSGGVAWLMSHPPSEKRARAIEALQADWDARGAPDPALRNG